MNTNDIRAARTWATDYINLANKTRPGPAHPAVYNAAKLVLEHTEEPEPTIVEKAIHVMKTHAEDMNLDHYVIDEDDLLAFARDLHEAGLLNEEPRYVNSDPTFARRRYSKDHR